MTKRGDDIQSWRMHDAIVAAPTKTGKLASALQRSLQAAAAAILPKLGCARAEQMPLSRRHVHRSEDTRGQGARGSSDDGGTAALGRENESRGTQIPLWPQARFSDQTSNDQHPAAQGLPRDDAGGTARSRVRIKRDFAGPASAYG